jgi:hypothetical protein
VQIRPDLPPFRSNSPLGAAREWSRKQAEARLPQLPLTPPNDVAALLVQQLRPEATPHHIALKPTATLWFEADHLGQRFSVPDPAPPGSLEAEGQKARREWAAIWREGQTMVTFGWATADPIGSREINDLQASKQQEAAGRVRVRWLRWLDHRRKDAPPQTERAFWISEMPWKWAFYIPRDVQPERMPLLFLDAEYEVATDPPEGLQKVPPFRLRLSGYGEVTRTRSPTLSLWCSDPRIQLETIEGRAAVQIPVEPEGVWRLRAMPDSTPQEGQLTLTLEGRGHRWQKQMSVEKADDIPPHWRCRCEDGTYESFARFVRLKAGRYTLRVEGTIAWLVQGSWVRPQAVAERKVTWQKALDLRPSWEETVIVPLPR